jgi:hypothetical protein
LRLPGQKAAQPRSQSREYSVRLRLNIANWDFSIPLISNPGLRTPTFHLFGDALAILEPTMYRGYKAVAVG